MSRQIRIMTYNIHSCIGMDGKASTQRIAEVIFRSGVDIVALQEVDTGLARTGLIDQAREITGFSTCTTTFNLRSFWRRAPTAMQSSACFLCASFGAEHCPRRRDRVSWKSGECSG